MILPQPNHPHGYTRHFLATFMPDLELGEFYRLYDVFYQSDTYGPVYHGADVEQFFDQMESP